MNNLIHTKSAVLLIVIFLTACGGGDGQRRTDVSNKAPTSDESKKPAPTNIATAIKAADENGSLPQLNRDETISGTDNDNNGVRDDIDAYITSLPDTPAQKNVLKQSAVALGNALKVDTTNRNALLEVSAQISAASWCRHNQYDTATASKKSAEIEKLMINTKIRFMAYDKFNAALSGTTSVSPQGDGCVK